MPLNRIITGADEDAREAERLCKIDFRNAAPEQIRERVRDLPLLLNLRRDEFATMFNTNTIDPALQRQVILDGMVRAFAVKVAPIKAFAKNLNSIPLDGTDKIDVPFFPLQTAASGDWDPAVGYTTGNTEQDTRELTINKRKYIGMSLTSSEMRRQPYQNWQQLWEMNAEKLAVDVVADIMSVVTAANYGAALKSVAAAGFSGDDVCDLYGSVTDLNWPDRGRSLVLTTAYKVALLKDPAFKTALAYGSSDVIRRANIQDAYGFEDIYTVPTGSFPGNNEHLTGFVCHSSAALVATSPIKPSPAVARLLLSYEVAADENSGIAIEYRQFGDAQKDKQSEIVECNYGFDKGLAAALARITSQ
jgi:hypothetical protein